MTTTIGTAPNAATGAVPRLARLPVLSIAAAVAVVHLVASVLGDGYMFDELQVLAIGRDHLDWGAADVPPVSPLLAALMDAIAPGSILALRIPAVLATAAAVVIAALIARELGGDRRAQVLTAGAQATALWITFTGHWLTPYTLEPVQWLLVFWLLVRWIRVRDDRLLLVLGVVVGIAALTKFQVLALCAVMALCVLALGPRELLRRPMLAAGAGIAALIAAPTLVWQAVHGWPQLRMGAIAAAEADYLFGGRWGVAALLVVCAGVAGTVLGLYGTGRLLMAAELRTYRFLGVAAVVMYVFFVVTAGRAYYMDGSYGLLAAAGALGLQRRREAGHRRLRWVAWPAYVVSAAVAAGPLAVSVPYASAAVPQKIVPEVAAAYDALPPAQRERTAVFGQSYIYAGYIDAYRDEYGLPPAYSGNRSYGYFAPPPEDVDTVLSLGKTGDDLRPFFRDVRRVGGEGDAGLWLATGRTGPWSEIWPRMRTLTVE
ncbi:dolichyl-phosphate-mannose-protein mannosyltransferase [Pseudonocardia sediminis]|uniref:Dolichyl-phosphate-mannose-protein mannosyltransferase n=1 Tax=Pseudonocardia sediminis TaxID=1397368 RepID=A0A4Q7USG6_PSEST|nr:glycosyltransferase family 39 protein [Pseudonocardia sediminis]RZT84817.1 dolichyl-phosphate-mannose-protein mannosyltransferase [Pseudonocardia sediminis]